MNKGTELKGILGHVNKTMERELEGLERLAMPDELHTEECKKAGVDLTEDYDLIKEALLELKSIKESDPSEALNRVLVVGDESKYWNPDDYIVDVNTLKQALLKAQENEKVIKAIKKHFNIKLDEETELNGNVWGRLVSIQAKEDNGTWDTTATANLVDYKEDFDLLREYFKYE